MIFSEEKIEMHGLNHASKFLEEILLEGLKSSEEVKKFCKSHVFMTYKNLKYGSGNTPDRRIVEGYKSVNDENRG